MRPTASAASSPNTERTHPGGTRATGSTMRAAVAALRSREPAAVVVAAPTGAPETCAAMRAIADACVCAITPSPFRAVGLWYADFEQTSDDEVRALLERAASRDEPAA